MQAGMTKNASLAEDRMKSDLSGKTGKDVIAYAEAVKIPPMYSAACLSAGKSAVERLWLWGGFGGVDNVWGTDDNGRSFPEYTTRFQAKYFNPPLPLLVSPEGCPDNVKQHLRNISSLLTGHPAAAANAPCWKSC